MIIDDSWDKKNGSTILIEGDLIEEVKSKYQHIEVFQTKRFGKLLRLDGVIQLTEFDEANYHEMLAHVPLRTHKTPDNVLVIGGGDGGIVREIVKYKKVKNIDLVEIDNKVIEISKKYLPDISCGLEDERVTIMNHDGAEYIKNCTNLYDIIIIDSTDPFSVGASLFKEEFYSNLKKALKIKGIVVSQSESMFYDKDLIKKMYKFKRQYFNAVRYYYTLVPTYPSGTIGFHFCSDGHYLPIDGDFFEKIEGLKYYNEFIHNSSFLTPTSLSN
jgi:spermidine synthase